MDRNNNREIALRIAELSTWGFDEALEALEGGGEAREAALSILHSREETKKIFDEIDKLRRGSQRPRFRFLW
jgi:hypothetical protein